MLKELKGKLKKGDGMNIEDYMTEKGKLNHHVEKEAIARGYFKKELSISNNHEGDPFCYIENKNNGKKIYYIIGEAGEKETKCAEKIWDRLPDKVRKVFSENEENSFWLKIDLWKTKTYICASFKEIKKIETRDNSFTILRSSYNNFENREDEKEFIDYILNKLK